MSMQLSRVTLTGQASRPVSVGRGSSSLLPTIHKDPKMLYNIFCLNSVSFLIQPGAYRSFLAHQKNTALCLYS